jgi:hypothetical protein
MGRILAPVTISVRRQRKSSAAGNSGRDQRQDSGSAAEDCGSDRFNIGRDNRDGAHLGDLFTKLNGGHERTGTPPTRTTVAGPVRCR